MQVSAITQPTTIMRAAPPLAQQPAPATQSAPGADDVSIGASAITGLAASQMRAMERQQNLAMISAMFTNTISRIGASAWATLRGDRGAAPAADVHG